MDVTARSKMKIVVWGRTQAHLEIFFIGKGIPWAILDYAILNNLSASEIGSTKVRILYFFHTLFYIFSRKLKTTKLTKLSYTSLKSWLKNLSNKYIYAEVRTEPEILASKVDHSAEKKRLTISIKFWLWRIMLGNRRQPGV
jgi:hypothetical protein